MRQNKKQLHELPDTKIVKSGTIRLASGVKVAFLPFQLKLDPRDSHYFLDSVPSIYCTVRHITVFSPPPWA